MPLHVERRHAEITVGCLSPSREGVTPHTPVPQSRRIGVAALWYAALYQARLKAELVRCEIKRRHRKDGKVRDGETKNMTYKNQDNSVLTPGEVACLLNIHINTVRRWSDMGILKAFRIGPRADRRFRRSDVLTFLPRDDGEKSAEGLFRQPYDH